MVLSTPRSAGASSAVGRCYASPQEQEAMVARLRARAVREAEILSPAQPSKAAGAETSSSSRCHAPPSDQEEMIARVGGSKNSEADWAEMRSRYERRQRAWDAHVKRHRTPNRRESRPAPQPSKQYCPALPTTPARDQRLSSGAVRTLMLIRAALGRDSGRIITRKYLAHTLGYSQRTAQRHLSLLRRYGYITTRMVNAPNGRVLGQRIQVTAKARPFWQGGGLDVSPLKPFPTNGVSEDGQRASQDRQTFADFAQGFASKGRSETPERRPPSG